MLPVALWVCPVGEFAGVARHITDVARVGLPGYRLIVTAPEGALLDRLYELGCPAVPLQVEGVPTHRTVRALRQTVSRLRPAVVHSHLAKADFLVAMATAGSGASLISTEHGIAERSFAYHGSRLQALGRQAAHHTRIRRFTQLIAVSEATRREMQRQWRPSAPITVIHNGIDRPTTPPRRTPGLRVLSLSRLAPEKNLDTTLRVFARARRARPDATLTVAGEGAQRPQLLELARELGIDDATSFPGFVEAQQAVADHDVLLQPSLAENFSYTLLDAVNHGLGVVASNRGGNPEVLPTHCLAPAHDVDRLAELVIEQGTRPSRRPRLPSTIPDVREMSSRIVDLYQRAGSSPPAMRNARLDRDAR